MTHRLTTRDSESCSASLLASLRQLHEQWRAKADDALYVPEDCAEVYLRCADALASLLALAESQPQERTGEETKT
jgi:hypothetical protein